MRVARERESERFTIQKSSWFDSFGRVRTLWGGDGFWSRLVRLFVVKMRTVFGLFL